MSVYIVKANYRYPHNQFHGNQCHDQGSNLGVYFSQEKAQAHFEKIIQHYRECGAEIHWDRHDHVEIAHHFEIRQAYISENNSTVQLVLEKW